MRGEVFVFVARGRGHEQRGPRYAVVLQPSELPLSTVLIAPTSTSARPTVFRPEVSVLDEPTLVLCDQTTAVDLQRLEDPVGYLTLREMKDVDEALGLVLGLL